MGDADGNVLGVLGLDDLLRVRIFAEQFGCGRRRWRRRGGRRRVTTAGLRSLSSRSCLWRLLSLLRLLRLLSLVGLGSLFGGCLGFLRRFFLRFVSHNKSN